jgi:hypothetical protein
MTSVKSTSGAVDVSSSQNEFSSEVLENAFQMRDWARVEVLLRKRKEAGLKCNVRKTIVASGSGQCELNSEFYVGLSWLVAAIYDWAPTSLIALLMHFLTDGEVEGAEGKEGGRDRNITKTLKSILIISFQAIVFVLLTLKFSNY